MPSFLLKKIKTCVMIKKILRRNVDFMNDINSNKEKEFYNKIGKIIGWDFSNIKYDVVDNSKFQYFDEINRSMNENMILLILC